MNQPKKKIVKRFQVNRRGISLEVFSDENPRKIWFLFHALVGKRLDLTNIKDVRNIIIVIAKPFQTVLEGEPVKGIYLRIPLSLRKILEKIRHKKKDPINSCKNYYPGICEVPLDGVPTLPPCNGTEKEMPFSDNLRQNPPASGFPPSSGFLVTQYGMQSAVTAVSGNYGTPPVTGYYNQSTTKDAGPLTVTNMQKAIDTLKKSRAKLLRIKQ